MTSRRTSDGPWWRGDPTRTPPHPHRGHVSTSEYVTMGDNTKIAVDVYLPKGLESGNTIPTIMYMTPYFRSMEYRVKGFERLLKRLSFIGAVEWAQNFARLGYATVIMDLRGSGASFGEKKSDTMFQALTVDGAEIVDWIVEQPWSNGNVGATGVSAPGMCAQMLLAAKHPAVKAIAPLWTAFDIFASAHPGGLIGQRWVQDVSSAMEAMDANRLHDLADNPVAKLVLRALVRGIRPVDDDRDRSMLTAACREHANNEHPDGFVAMTYRDEPMPGTSETLDTRSPFMFASDLEASGAAIYSYGGMLDAAFGAELIKLHNTVRTPGSRLTLGPWGHAGRFYTSPHITAKRSTDFPHADELARFFDLHLRGVDRGVSEEKPVHYFTLGEERWHAADTWPPPTVDAVYHLGPKCTLTSELTSGESTDSHNVDFATTPGIHSRFGKHTAGGRFLVRYPDRAERDRSLLTYTSDPLEAASEVTGHPIVTLFASSSTADAAFIVYLEDVLPDGTVLNVTDGMLRASFRALSSTAAPYWTPGIYRSCTRAEAAPMTPGEISELVFDLLPVSYLFRAGHRIRIAIAGADKDNFLPVPESGEAPVLQIAYGGMHPSRIELPVVPRA